MNFFSPTRLGLSFHRSSITPDKFTPRLRGNSRELVHRAIDLPYVERNRLTEKANNFNRLGFLNGLANTREKEIVLGLNIYKPHELVILSIRLIRGLTLRSTTLSAEREGGGEGFKDRSFA